MCDGGCVCLYVCVSICVCVSVCGCVYLCVSVCVCVYLYVSVCAWKEALRLDFDHANICLQEEGLRPGLNSQISEGANSETLRPE